MAALDEGHVEKKFRNASITQESIQSLSLWVVHHKAQHEKIVNIWFTVLKKSKLDHRLTLFYLANDIVQTCRKKHAVMYKDAFKEVMKDATLLVRDHAIKPPIERIFNIWKERGIYEAEFVEELVAIINNVKVRATMNSKLLSEFQPLTLMEKVITLKRFEDEIELKRRQLRNLRMDASSIEAVKQLKDRTHGGEFCAEFESACTKMEDYVNSLEKENSDRVALIEMLEQSELFYDAQYGEAKIVANAYKNFGSRVNNLQRKLEHKMISLPDSVSPLQSPSVAAQSPDNSPVNAAHFIASKSLYDGQQEYQPDSPAPPGVTTPERLDSDQLDMNTETVDMEMSDDESATNNKGNRTHEKLDDVEMSPKSDDDDVMAPQGSPLVLDHEDKKSAYIPAVAKGATTSFLDEILKSNSAVSSKKDTEDGGSTPVMDECESTASTAEKSKSQKQNPIDFLTSLIGQTKKPTTSGSSNSSGSRFFDNLSLLTKNVTSQYEPDKEPSTNEHQPTTADAWAAWKAQNTPPAPMELPAPTTPMMSQVPPQPVAPLNSEMAPKIHPTLLPPPTPPFAAPMPPPPFPPADMSGFQQAPQRQDSGGSYPPGPSPPVPPPPPLNNYPATPGGSGQQMDSPAYPFGADNNYLPPGQMGNNNYPYTPNHQNNYPGAPQGNYGPRFPAPGSGQQQQQPFPPSYSQDNRYNSQQQGSSASTTPSPTYPSPSVSQNSMFPGPQTGPGQSGTGTPPSPYTPTGNTNYTPDANPYSSPRFPPPSTQSHRLTPRFNNLTSSANQPVPSGSNVGGFMRPPPTPPVVGLQAQRFPVNSNQQIPISSQSSTGAPFNKNNNQRSNLTTIKTVDDSEFQSQDPPSPNEKLGFSASTGVKSYARTDVNNSFSPKPPLRPPNSNSMQPMITNRNDFTNVREGQQEFIEKLKKKSNIVSDFNLNPAEQSHNNSGSNLRTLTQVAMDTGRSNSDGVNQPDSNQSVPANKPVAKQDATESAKENKNTDLGSESLDEDCGEESVPFVGQDVGGFLQRLRAESDQRDTKKEFESGAVPRSPVPPRLGQRVDPMEFSPRDSRPFRMRHPEGGDGPWPPRPRHPFRMPLEDDFPSPRGGRPMLDDDFLPPRGGRSMGPPPFRPGGFSGRPRFNGPVGFDGADPRDFRHKRPPFMGARGRGHGPFFNRPRF